MNDFVSAEQVAMLQTARWAAEYESGNPSGLEPVGQAVLVRPYEPPMVEGMIIIPDQARERMQLLETRAVVIAIGPAAWQDEAQPRVKVGDRVLIAKMAGVVAVGIKDGVTYRLVNGRDVFCKLKGESDGN